MKTFHNKEKLKEFVTIKPALQKIFKGFLHKEEETRVRQEDLKGKTLLSRQTMNR
jgi:hypothetical protein